MTTDRLFQVLYQMPAFPDVLRQHTNYGIEFRKHVDSFVAFTTCSKQQLLLKPGQRADTAHFLNRGRARGYMYDERRKKDFTIFLWEESSFVMDVNGFYLNKPSSIYIEVFPGAELIWATYADVQRTFTKFPESGILARTLVLQENKFHIQRYRTFRTLAAGDRYEQLLNERPGIEQKFSLQIIASYLGINPETLSRMRRP